PASPPTSSPSWGSACPARRPSRRTLSPRCPSRGRVTWSSTARRPTTWASTRGTTRCGTRRARARSSPCGRSGTAATSATAACPASPPDARPRMPEGHTLHRLAGALDGAFGGTAPEVSSPQGRFADGAGLLDGSVVDRAWAHGKLLFVDFADGRTLYV